MSVRQANQISVGEDLPLAQVEVVTDGCALDDNCQIALATELLGKGRVVLVGMPGAFTPTCTDEHLPGFIRNSRRFKRLGVKEVAVLTTNDRFMMTAWKKAMRGCMEAEGLGSLDTQVTMLADDKSDFVRALGLAYNLAPKKAAAWSFQLNAGLRSKRFALVANDGVVEHLAVDEGETGLSATSADAILEYLGSRRVAVGQPSLQPSLAIGGLADLKERRPLVKLVVGVVAAALVATIVTYVPTSAPLT